MIFIVLSSSILFIIDMILLSQQISMPNFIRCYYFYTFMIAIIYYVNINARQQRLENEKIKQDEQATKLIKTFLTFCAPLLEKLNGVEQIILSDIARSFTNFTVIKSELVDYKQLEIILKNLILKLKSVGLELKITNTYPNLLVEVDEMTKKILKYYYNIK